MNKTEIIQEILSNNRKSVVLKLTNLIYGPQIIDELIYVMRMVLVTFNLKKRSFYGQKKEKKTSKQSVN